MKKTLAVSILIISVFLVFQNSKGHESVANNAFLVPCCNQMNPWQIDSDEWSLACIGLGGGTPGDISISRDCCKHLWILNGYNPPSPYAECVQCRD